MPLRDRVTLYYVLCNRQVTDTYLFNKGDPKRRKAMAQAVADFYGDDPFIWSVNQAHKESGAYGCLPVEVIGDGGEMHPAYLTPKSNGINCYQNLHGAAWSGTLKLSQTLLDILSRVWGREEARQRALQEYELYACLQFLSRPIPGASIATPLSAIWWRTMCRRNTSPRGGDCDRIACYHCRWTNSIKADLDDVRSKGTGRKKTISDDEKRENARQRQAKSRASKSAASGRKAGQCGRPRKNHG